MTFAEYPIRFEVLSALSSGGMGRVDVARLLDVPGDVLIAVKRPHRHMSDDDDFARMFMEEARLTWAIQHPNVARLVGWGRDDESIYMATEYVSGGPLHEIARRGRRSGEPMSPTLIAFIIGRAAEGLAGAHGLTFDDGTPANIVHRDISPSNIMVGFDGRVKIIDFGVAKIAQGGNALRTATGVLKGKVPYMAPEYARGGAVDISCDLYSLGVVLYELLCGRRPFSAEHDLELLRKVAEDPPPPILAEVPALDPDYAAFVHQLLAKTKVERPASAYAIVTVLDAFLLRQGCSHEQMQAELSDYVTRYGQSRAPLTRSSVEIAAPRGSGDGMSRSHQPPVDNRAFTRAVTPSGEQYTRVSSEPNHEPRNDPRFDPRSDPSSAPLTVQADVLAGRTPASTNSALFVPPTAPTKPPIYLWMALAMGLFSLFVAVVALFLVSNRGPAPLDEKNPAAAGRAPSAELPVATAPPDTAAPPPPLPPSASTTTPPVHPPLPPINRPPVVAVKKVACTPSSFDYPRCLKKLGRPFERELVHLAAQGNDRPRGTNPCTRPDHRGELSALNDG